VCEWLAGNLAKGFGLNVPDFRLAHVPAQLVELHPDGRDLGTGTVFASRAAPISNEIVYSEVERVPARIRRDVAAFDWWTQNSDRTLTERGGNPNLLWSAAEQELVVIDHNLAFDSEFDAKSFLDTHIFRNDLRDLCSDLEMMASYATRMQALLPRWAEALAQVPDEWYFHDDERSVPICFDVAASYGTLERCLVEDIWRLP